MIGIGWYCVTAFKVSHDFCLPPGDLLVAGTNNLKVSAGPA
jgi:hypothetical protein